MAEIRADLSLESVQLGQQLVMSLAGLGACVVTAVLVDRPWVFVVGGLAGIAGGLGMAVVLNRRIRRPWERTVPEGSGPPRRSHEAGVLIGAVWALAAITAGALVLVLEVGVLDDTSLYQVGGPLMLVFAFSVALTRRDLQRWQSDTGLLLCTRLGARRFAWTGAQARARLLIVAAGATPAGRH